MPKFSIIIPVYNVGKYLNDCLVSVMRQSFVDWECICVDDGSIDGSRDVIERFVALDKRFQLVTEDNTGVGGARNAGIDLAQGEWICFVDGDDYISESWLKLAATAIARHPHVEILALPNGLVEIGEAHENYETTDASLCKGQRVRVKELVGAYAKRWAARHYSRNGWAALSFVKRSFVGSTRFNVDVRIKEDILFFLELTLRLNRIVVANYTGYLYRQRAGSALHRVRVEEDGVALLDALGRYPVSLRDSLSRTAAWDLIQWERDRDSSIIYDSEKSPLLAKWRGLVASSSINVSAIHFWWRPAVLHWLRTGDLSWIMRTRWARLALGNVLRRFMGA